MSEKSPLSFGAYQCKIDLGIRLLPDDESHYCEGCGHLLKRIGPLHSDVIKMMRDAAHLSHANEELKEMGMLRARISAYQEELIKLKAKSGTVTA